MNNVKLVALRRHPYAVGFREADEHYEATQEDAATLIALGWAKRASDTKQVENKAIAAKADEVKPVDRQGYRTRDLKSKG